MDASQNQLVRLHDGIGQWRAMERLVLSQNQISELPPSFTQMRALRVCCLESNSLKNSPGAGPEDEMPQLETLSVTGNNFPRSWKPPAVFRMALLPHDSPERRNAGG